MARVNHFEIHSADPQAAAKFYTDVFGWKISKWDGPMDYWLVSTGEGPGIDGGIVPRRGAAPDSGAAVNGYV
ncbi:MAG: VOC family protein, partial [Candidatus Cybelea sp.]